MGTGASCNCDALNSSAHPLPPKQVPAYSVMVTGSNIGALVGQGCGQARVHAMTSQRDLADAIASRLLLCMFLYQHAHVSALLCASLHFDHPLQFSIVLTFYLVARIVFTGGHLDATIPSLP